MKRDDINRMIWKELNNGVFFFYQIPLLCLGAREVNSLPFGHYLEFLGPRLKQVFFFFWESSLENF